MDNWAVVPYTRADKLILVTGPNDLFMMVDFDDVDHYEVERQIRLMVDALNESKNEQAALAA